MPIRLLEPRTVAGYRYGEGTILDLQDDKEEEYLVDRAIAEWYTGDTQDLSGLLNKSSNLSDLTNTVTARSNLGLGTMALQDAIYATAYGAVGDGETDNLAAITNVIAAADGRTVIFPMDVAGGQYAIKSGTVSIPVDVFLRFEGTAVLYEDGGTIENLSKSITFHGGARSRGITWLSKHPQPGSDWVEKSARFGVYSASGGLAIAGASHTANGGGGSIGVTGYCVQDNAEASSSSWAGYFDAKRTADSIGHCTGIEIDVINFGEYKDWYSGIGGDYKSFGLAVAAGGGVEINGETNTCTSAINISNNGANFGVGLIFSGTALMQHTDHEGIANFKAIVMRNSYTVGWESQAGDSLGFLRSIVSNQPQETSIILADNNILLRGVDGARIAQFSHSIGGNYLWFKNSSTSPVIETTGSSTNIDLTLTPKGTGAVLADGIKISRAGLLADFVSFPLELGKIGTSNTPLIDFHSGATSVDYDSRIIATGGTGASGGGSLAFYSSTCVFSGSLYPDTMGTKALGGSSFRWGTLNTHTIPSGTGMLALTSNITDAGLSTADITTNNATAEKHGFLPKLSGVSTQFMNGNGSWSVPAISDATIGITDVTTNNASASKHGFLPKLSGTATEFLNGSGEWSVPYTKDTGWTAMTGTADESTALATSTVTVEQLAGRVKALQDVLTSHGFIGA